MKLVLRILVSAGLIALLVLILPADELWHSLTGFDPRIWGAVFAAFLLGHRLGVEKWRTLLRSGGASLTSGDAVSCYASGLFANLFLPTIVGGDVLRATLASRRTSRTEAVVVASIADRVIDVIVLVILVVAGGIAAGSSVEGPAGRTIVLTVLASLGIGALILALVSRRPLRRWPRRVRRPLGRSMVALRRLARNPGPAFLALALSLSMQGGFVLLNAWIGLEVGIDIPLVVWFLVWPLAKAAGLLPVSIGGLGVRDATLGALLVPLGVPMSLGVAASFVWQSVILAGGLAAGVIWRLSEDGAGILEAVGAGSAPSRRVERGEHV